MRAFLAALLAFAGLAHAAPPALAWSLTDHSQFIAAAPATAARTNVPYGGYWQSAKSDLSQSVGVRYVEFHVDEIGAGAMVGLANGLATTNNSLGTDSNSVAYWSIGNTLKNGTWGGVLPPTFTTGDTLGMLVDLGAHTVKFRKGTGAYSAALDISSLGPDVYVAVTLGPNAPATSITITSDTWNDYPAPTAVFVGHGDSITIGPLKSYVQRVAELLEANRTGAALWARLGINGASWNFAWVGAGYPYTLTQDATIRVDPLRSATLPSWLACFGGTNAFAIQHQTAANEYAFLQAYVAARIAAGWQADHILVPTMLPRTGVSETDRTAYNALIVADAGHLGYRVVRFDLNPNFGLAGQNTDTSKYSDGTHPTDATQQLMAQDIVAVMVP